MLKDVVTKVKAEIELERKSRETTEETLLGLLEDTCGKLNAASLAWKKEKKFKINKKMITKIYLKKIKNFL